MIRLGLNGLCANFCELGIRYAAYLTENEILPIFLAELQHSTRASLQKSQLNRDMSALQCKVCIKFRKSV